jgi:Fungal chitosanase of glycosyl hydrolase group 75
MPVSVKFLRTDPACVSIRAFQQALRDQEDLITVITAIGQDFDVSHPENRLNWLEYDLPLTLPTRPSALVLRQVPINAANDLVAYQAFLEPLLDQFTLVDVAVLNLGGNDVEVVLLRPGSTGQKPTTPQPESATQPKLPPFVANLLTSAKGVPWSQAKALPAINGYTGIVQDTFRVFQGLQKQDGNPMSAICYVSKFDIDNDGSGGNTAGDHFHSNNTSLRDANGVSLNANDVPYAVIPMDFFESQMTHRQFPAVALKRAGLPDFSSGLGLNLGDLGVAFWGETGSGMVRQAFFIYGDTGPANQLGEGSVRLAQTLGVRGNPNSTEVDLGKVRRGIGVVHIGFPGSGQQLLVPGSKTRSKLVPDHIAGTAEAYHQAFLNQPAPIVLESIIATRRTVRTRPRKSARRMSKINI